VIQKKGRFIAEQVENFLRRHDCDFLLYCNLPLPGQKRRGGREIKQLLIFFYRRPGKLCECL
jgi:hypothetical protein